MCQFSQLNTVRADAGAALLLISSSSVGVLDLLGFRTELEIPHG